MLKIFQIVEKHQKNGNLLHNYMTFCGVSVSICQTAQPRHPSMSCLWLLSPYKGAVT